MNAIQRAIADMPYRIPPQILQEVFIKRNQDWRQSGHATISEQIHTLVVRGRVLPDVKLIGGTTANVPLFGLEMIRVNDFDVVFRIPKDRTSGRSINSVLHIGFAAVGMGNAWGSPGHSMPMGGYNIQENTATSAVLQQLLASADRIPITSTCACTLIGDNVIRVRDAGWHYAQGFLHCIVGDDDNLSHLPIAYYDKFSTLLTYAVKSYIYNHLIISMDQQQLMAGMQLGSFKDQVMQYADAEQNYQDYKDGPWRQVGTMADQVQYDRFLEMMLGNAM